MEVITENPKSQKVHISHNDIYLYKDLRIISQLI